MMRSHPAVKGVDRLGPRRLESSRGEVGQSVSVGLFCDEGGQDGSPAAAEDIARHFGQLDARVFKRLLDPLRMPGDLAHQLLARAREITQLLDRRGRDEAARISPSANGSVIHVASFLSSCDRGCSKCASRWRGSHEHPLPKPGA